MGASKSYDLELPSKLTPLVIFKRPSGGLIAPLFISLDFQVLRGSTPVIPPDRFRCEGH